MPQPLRAALVLLVLASSAPAQEIGEEEFVAVFGAEHAASRSLEEGLVRAEAARRRAGVLANPRLDFWQERPEDSPRVTNWTLAWTPPFDGRWGLSRRAADARVRTAKERLAADTARLRSELRGVFAAWSLALEREGLARRQHDRVRTLASRERERARVGEGSGLSARRLGLAEGEARAAAGEAEAERARAEATARAWRP
ncbi:MAG TPA: TolC family protein, partial [Vicinamibacteria bacterium]|nr:TolC family protein [Vicinamibacteria bacterium]